MVHLVIYTKTNCVQCKMTLALVKQLGIPYVDNYYGDESQTNQLDLESKDDVKRQWSEQKVEDIKSKYNIHQMPLVKALDDEGNMVEFWGGFQPTKIKKYSVN